MNFKKRVNGSWTDTPHYIHNTSTDTITTPADIYTNDTTATVGLKGNMSQTGTPTPDKPVMPEGCGDLEATGEHAGQYKIPISNGQQTTNIYLGSMQTVRQIKKVVLTGKEYWDTATVGTNRFFYTYVSDSAPIYTAIPSTHYTPSNESGAQRPDNSIRQVASGARAAINIRDDACATLSDFKQYLAAQYAAGTPVTVWYVLAAPETATVNEPLMKIGDYADEVSGITIPTIAGANTLSVDTTLQPSEVSVNYKGWHPVSAVHERENGQWD